MKIFQKYVLIFGILQSSRKKTLQNLDLFAVLTVVMRDTVLQSNANY